MARVGRRRGLRAAVDGTVAAIAARDLLAMVLDHALGERGIELLAGMDQRPGAGRR